MTKSINQYRVQARKLKSKLTRATNKGRLIFLTIDQDTQIPEDVLASEGLLEQVDYQVLPSALEVGGKLRKQFLYTNLVDKG